MIVPFDTLPDHSRLWIYQADRKITPTEISIISDALHSFIDSWLVHGHPMTAGFTIRANQFVIIGADEMINAASGCSIDKAVRQMTEIGSTLGIDWFNRNNIAFEIDGDVKLLQLKNLKRCLEYNEWSASTNVFDNTISTKSHLENKWIVPARKTWLNRYLPKERMAP